MDTNNIPSSLWLVALTSGYDDVQRTVNVHDDMAYAYSNKELALKAAEHLTAESNFTWSVIEYAPVPF